MIFQMNFPSVSVSFALTSLIIVVSMLPGPCFQTEDKNRNTEKLIRSRGFDAEVYNVTTEDGYILNVNRIVDPNCSNQTTGSTETSIVCHQRKPIILGHGLFLSADSFLLNSPSLTTNDSLYGNNLGFSLMLAGKYDVWLVNFRGNDYSQTHVNGSRTDQKQYWHFSFDQMAEMDLPAVINLVQQTTGFGQKIGYIGHSQGTTIMFALLATKPEYVNIIEPFIALAPVIYTEHSRSIYRYFARLTPLLRYRGGQFIMTKEWFNNAHIKTSCSLSSLLCWMGVSLLLGYDHTNLNNSRLELYARWYGVSDWNVAHWSQLYLSNRFTRFDYGSSRLNREHYGQETAPNYNLSSIPMNAKIAIFQSKNDRLSTLKDGLRLKQELLESGIQLIDDYLVDDKCFTHVDFMYGKNAGQQYIDHLIDLLDRFS